MSQSTESPTDLEQPFVASADAVPVRIERDTRRRLVLHHGETVAENVSVARCFPWSRPGEYVSVRDAEGKEIVLIESLDTLPAATRAMIEEELAWQSFVPRITAFEQVEHESELVTCRVATDRGPIDLQIRHAEDVRELDDGRMIIKDHAGGLYLVPDITALDAQSQRLAEHLGA